MQRYSCICKFEYIYAFKHMRINSYPYGHLLECLQGFVLDILRSIQIYLKIIKYICIFVSSNILAYSNICKYTNTLMNIYSNICPRTTICNVGCAHGNIFWETNVSAIYDHQSWWSNFWINTVPSVYLLFHVAIG